jgi:hypothetical protein
MASSNRSVDDEAWLASVARDLRRRLSKSARVQTRSGPVEETNTGGWNVRLGHSRAAKTTHIALWFDHYFGFSRPRILWSGFYWSSRLAFTKACGLWASRVRDNRKINNQDVSFRRQTYTLKQPRVLRKLYLERYDTGFFLGMFCSRPTAAAKTTLLAEADRFLSTALTTDGRIDFAYVERRLLKKEDLAALEETDTEEPRRPAFVEIVNSWTSGRDATSTLVAYATSDFTSSTRDSLLSTQRPITSFRFISASAGSRLRLPISGRCAPTAIACCTTACSVPALI